MSYSKVTSKFQITIPRDVRREVGIKAGDVVKVGVEGGRVILEKMRDPVEDMVGLAENLFPDETCVSIVRRMRREDEEEL